MDILDKMPVKFIKEYLSKGGSITISQDYDTKEAYLDLNIQMKSHLYLYYVESKGYVAKCRYNESFMIEIFYDLYSALRWCECNKGFMNGNLTEIYNNGFDDNDADFE